MSKVLLQWETWVYGLIAGFIGGGANAVIASTAVTMIAPHEFNTGAQLHNLLLLVGFTFLGSGLLSAMAFLAKSPLPPLVTVTTTETTVEPTAVGVKVSEVATTTQAKP